MKKDIYLNENNSLKTIEFYSRAKKSVLKNFISEKIFPKNLNEQIFSYFCE